MKSESLDLRPPFGRLPLLTLAWLVVLIGLAEFIVRNPAIRPGLPAQGLGSAHRQFEVQWDRLDKRTGVDCLIIGNSHVQRGIDPAALERAFEQASGQTITCQNMGLAGTSVRLYGQMAALFAQKSQPRLILVGLSAVDFDDETGGKGNRSILESPWVQYKQGIFKLDGWALDGAASYRHYLGWYGATYFAARQKDQGGTNIDENTHPNGYYPSSTIYNFNEPDDDLKVIQESAKNLQFRPEMLAALDPVLALGGPQTQIVLIETPFSPALYEIIPTYAPLQEKFETSLQTLAAQQGLAFWQTSGLEIIPTEGWADFKHPNDSGAQAFSAWLGQQLGQAVASGALSLPGGR